jgi:glycosyltransferase involved in cell wall biosynthesis
MPGEPPLTAGPIRVVSIVEAQTITGPVKPLLMFSGRARQADAGQPRISHTVMTTVRGRRGQPGAHGEFLRAAADVGIPVDIVAERFWLDAAVLRQMARFLTTRDPHIIETHGCKSHFLLWLLRARRRVPAAHWLAFHHGYTRTSLKVRGYQQLDRLSLPAADRVVTFCKPFARALVDRGVAEKRIELITNAVELRAAPSAREVAELRARLGLAAGERVVLTVGRLSAEKGHAILLAALRRLQERPDMNGVRLVIAGTGNEETRLRSSATDLGTRALFLGHQPDPWPLYHAADVFVLPSLTEGSPLVLFEAMGAGLPIVASAVGGIPEMISDGESGLLVPPDDADRLADALARVLSDGELRERLAVVAREQSHRFSPEQYTRRLLAIYASLLGGAGGPLNA